MQEHHTGPSDRRFGIEIAIVFSAVSVYRGAAWILLITAAFVATALVQPHWLRPLNKVWTRIGGLLARCLQPVASATLFFFVFTPAGILSRLLRRDALRLQPQPQHGTYWLPRGPQAVDWRRQF